MWSGSYHVTKEASRFILSVGRPDQQAGESSGIHGLEGPTPTILHALNLASPLLCWSAVASPGRPSGGWQPTYPTERRAERAPSGSPGNPFPGYNLSSVSKPTPSACTGSACYSAATCRRSRSASLTATAVHAVLLGLVSATEALIRRAVRAEPESLPAMLQAIDGMRASVLRVGQPVETRFGPMNETGHHDHRRHHQAAGRR
jgi:hypothetical protein